MPFKHSRDTSFSFGNFVSANQGATDARAATECEASLTHGHDRRFTRRMRVSVVCATTWAALFLMAHQGNGQRTRHDHPWVGFITHARSVRHGRVKRHRISNMVRVEAQTTLVLAGLDRARPFADPHGPGSNDRSQFATSPNA
jgi:hypothetical protein